MQKKKESKLVYGLSLYFSLLALNLFSGIYPPITLGGFCSPIWSLSFPLTYCVLERVYLYWAEGYRSQLFWLTLFFHGVMLGGIALIGCLQPALATDTSIANAWSSLLPSLIFYGLLSGLFWSLISFFLLKKYFLQGHGRAVFQILLWSCIVLTKGLGSTSWHHMLLVGGALHACWHLFQLSFGARHAPSDSYVAAAYPTTYLLFSFFFWCLLLITNLATTSFVSVLGYSCTMGLFFYPFTFLITDFLTECYTERLAIKTVWGGFFVNGGASLGLLLLSCLPTQESWMKSSFNNLFGWLPGVFLASIAAYLVAQPIDIYLFSWLRARTNGRHLWLRNNLATILSEALDTAVFAFVLWGVWPLLAGKGAEGLLAPSTAAVWLVVQHEYWVKVLLALLDTPLLYIMLYAFRHHKRRGAVKKNQRG